MNVQKIKWGYRDFCGCYCSSFLTYYWKYTEKHERNRNNCICKNLHNVFFLFVFVCCVWMCVCGVFVCPWIHKQRGQRQVSSSVLLTLFPDTVSHGTGAHQLARLQTGKPQGSSASSLSNGIIGLCHQAWLSIWVLGSPASRSHVCRANTSPIESSPSPQELNSYESWNTKSLQEEKKNSYSYLKEKDY